MGSLTGGAYSPPEPLAEHHDVEDFDSGEPVMDDWLRRRAIDSQVSGASRVFVVTDGGPRVVAYFVLAAGSVRRAEAVAGLRRNMPDPIPVVVLARLAVDQRHQGAGLGRALVRDAVLKSARAAEVIGVRAILVHALNDRVRQFYLKLGFRPSPVSELTLMVSIAEAPAAASAPPPHTNGKPT